MRWKRIFRRKRWYLLIPAFVWWFIWEFTKDTIMQATRDYFIQQGLVRVMLDYLMQNPVIIVGAVVIGTFIWAYVDTKYESGRTADSELANILIGIHERMLKLKDNAVKKYRSEHTSKEFLALHKELMIIMDKDGSLENLQRDLKGKKLSKIQIKRRKQINGLHEATKNVTQTEVSLDGLVRFIDTLNRLAQSPSKQYQALDILRSKDRKWNKLFSSLQVIKLEYNDAILNEMIDDYIKWSYGCSGLILHADLIRWYIPPQNLQSQYLGSAAYNPNIEVENKMTRLRGRIINRVRRLDTMDNKGDKTIIKDTKVKLDAEKVDKATGIEINKPTEMSNVHLDMKLHDVKEGTGIKSGLPLNVVMTTCKRCGTPLPAVSFGAPISSVKCDKCGEVNEINRT